MLIVIDGPEKAGKTTVIAALEALAGKHGFWSFTKVHHGKECAGDDGSVYASNMLRLQHEVEAARDLVVFDRAWPSEWVYGILMGRQSRITKSPFFVERMLGGTAAAYGACGILLGPSTEALAALRTGDDHPVDPGEERAAYRAYAAQFNKNWQAYENGHTFEQATLTAGDLLRRATLKFEKETEHGD
jgi:hypothetical protein